MVAGALIYIFPNQKTFPTLLAYYVSTTEFGILLTSITRLPFVLALYGAKPLS